MSKNSHGNPSLGDIVRTTAVMGLLLLLLAGVGWLFSADPPEQERGVDYQSALVSARRDATFPLLAPTELPRGWYANSVQYETGEMGRWHVGVVTDEEAYIGLQQTPVSMRRTVEEYASKTVRQRDVTVAGQMWELRSSGQGETTLVRRDNGVTVLLTGTAPLSVIKSYASSLSTGEEDVSR